MINISKIKNIFCILAVALCAVMAGCIENNIPYPRIQVNFTSFDVEGAVKPAAIDSAARTVTVFLDEAVDIENVVLNGFSLNIPQAQWPDSATFLNGINLSRPRNAVLSLYQNYVWSVRAVQTVNRYFTIEGQVGATTIDAAGHRIIVHVPAKAKVKRLLVTSLKLGGPSATVTPDINGQYVDFTLPVDITVTEFGRATEWTIFVIPVESAVETVRVDAWSRVAWLYGSAEAGKDNGFEYKAEGAADWTRLPASAVTSDGGSFTGRLTGLTPLTTYKARAYSGSDFGAEIEFTTEAEAQMPNSDFEAWWLDGKVWCPWAEGGTPYWGTGNKGAATMGASNSFPSDDTPTGKGRSACLETRFVGLGVIGKLAAGNIFVGDYVRTDGTNGVLSFGRPFTLHPTRLTGWMKYHSAPISHVAKEFEHLKGKPDTGAVWIALIDTQSPLEIRTNPKDLSLFDPNAPYVIAYGKMEWSADVSEWTKFEITLNYCSTSRRPTYIVCAGSASNLGDYFTGGAGSVMYLDDLRLHYDY